MGASRKLQGEIDRVLKKVQEGVDVFDSIWNKVYESENANQKEKFEADLKKEIKKLQRYRDQIKTWIQSSEIKDKKALVDARKLIEREMERFKVCEKETKTKAFSKEGLGQQPKTDPKEKAKSETRDWINTVVSELENQIDNFEAEVEGLTVKKGKARPPRLAHLETSITRHKAHIMKLELILRLLDNDELSPEQVNDVKDFLDDYVDRNQEDFDDFIEVDDLYSSLPLDKVEALEDLVIIGPPGLVKGAPILGIKSSVVASVQQAAATSSHQQSASVQEPVEDTASQDAIPDTAPPPPRTPTKSSITAAMPAVTHGVSAPVNIPPRVGDTTGAATNPSPVNMPSSLKEEDIGSFPGRRSSPSFSDAGIVKGIGRGGIATQQQTLSSVPLASSPNTSSLASAADMAKRNMEEKLGSSGGMVQPLASPLSNRMMIPQAAKAGDGTASLDSTSIVDANSLSNRAFSPSMQWRPGSETGHIRGRTEIMPDQREKFLQKLQQVQQQSQSNLLGMQSHKQFNSQQPNPLLQQYNPQSSSVSQAGLGIGIQMPGLGNVTPSILQQQTNSVHPLSNQPTLGSLKESELGLAKSDEQQQPNLPDDPAADSSTTSGLGKNLMSDDDLKPPYTMDSQVGASSGLLTEATQVGRDIDLSSGQLLQANQSSGSLGVIGRRSISDLGAIGDNIAPTSSASHDQLYNLQMLDAAYFKLPQPKDSERARSYTPRHPAMTPLSYPQVQAPIVNNPTFWERLGLESYSTDTLFFSFYYQQNTYQQYLAAKELKKQSWRYHRKYNTWFQRHEEPKVATDEYEQGTYVYFDFHTVNDEQQSGWCQRIKTDFTFEYNYLEDELIV